jgi:hypothetical protein
MSSKVDFRLEEVSAAASWMGAGSSEIQAHFTAPSTPTTAGIVAGTGGCVKSVSEP